MTENVVWNEGKINSKDRCNLLNQKGFVVWFTGLSGSGKSTLAAELEKELFKKNLLAYRLDGDNIRHHLNKDLGFSDEDRKENIRRIAEVAALFKDAGIITLVSCISPHRDMREYAKERVGKENFIEVYVKASLEICKKREVKGLYKKVDKGEIKDFTGFSSDYEEPENPDVVLDTEKFSITKANNFMLNSLLERFI
jgi:adenylyl-sulfate kinase